MANKNVLARQSVNATLYWPNLNTPNKYSKKYQVDLALLSDAAVGFFEKHGVNVRNKGDERGNFITSKSGYEIVPYDSEGAIVSATVGNGTKAVAKLEIVEGVGDYGPWVTASIKRLEITDLVEYEAEEDDGSFAEAL